MHLLLVTRKGLARGRSLTLFSGGYPCRSVHAWRRLQSKKSGGGCPKTPVYNSRSTKTKCNTICQKPCARKFRARTAQGWRKGSKTLMV